MELNKMEDIIKLKSSQKGKGLRFIISPAIREGMNIKFGDTIMIYINGIYKEGGVMIPVEPKIPMPSLVSKVGAKTQGITITRRIIKLLNLKEGQMLAIDIKKPEDV